MSSRRRKVTSDGAIVIEKNGELIVRDDKLALSWFDAIGERYGGMPPETRIPAFIELAEHFGRLNPDQTAALREQLSGFRARD